MRIGLLIYGSLDTVSGGYLYDRTLVDYLRAQCEFVEIFSLPWRNYPAHLTDNFSRALFNRLRAAQLDILIQDELNHPSLFALNHRLKRRTKYPLVAIVHHLRSSEDHPSLAQQLYRPVEKRYLNSIDGFIFNSHTTKQVVESLTGVVRPSVVAHPGGNRLNVTLTPQAITARAKETGPLHIVFVGNVIPRKGLHTLLAALARIESKGWRLTIIGSTAVDESYTRQIKQIIQQHALQEHITFTGSVSDSVLIQLLSQAHILVVPSSYEGFGIVYLEGMAFGLPAIATSAGAAGEIITHGENGYLIPLGDHVRLAESLSPLITDRQQLLELSLNAHRTFDQHATWAETTANIYRFLQHFLRNYHQ